MSRRAVPCEHCGRMFFPASLKIHQKTCRDRQQKVLTECLYCGLEMPQAELDEHLKRCKKALAVPGAAAGDSVPSRLPDGRVRCQFCGRGFAANRVQQHSAICGKLKQARPKGPNGAATQVPEKVYDAVKQDFAPREASGGARQDAAPREAERPRGQNSVQVNSKRVGAEVSPESSPERPRGGSKATSGEADPDGWRAKHREFIDAIRNARRGAKQGPPNSTPEVAQAPREPYASPPESPAVQRHGAAAAPEAQPEPNALSSPQHKAPRQKGAAAKAAAAAPGGGSAVVEERRRPRPQPMGGSVGMAAEGEAFGAAPSVEQLQLSPKALGTAPSVEQLQLSPKSLSPVLRRASAPSGSTPTGGGYPATPSSQGAPSSPGTQESELLLEPSGEWVPGARVQVQGLVNAPQLNGQMAVLLDFDLDASCWLVRLENGVVKAMRSEHMTKLQVPKMGSRANAAALAGTPEPEQGGSACSPSPAAGSRTLMARGPSPQKRGTSKGLRPSASVGPRRLKAAQTPDAAHEAPSGTLRAGSRPPKAPRSSSVEPRRTPTDSPRPRRSEYTCEVGGRTSEIPRVSAGGAKFGTTLEDDSAPKEQQPSSTSRSLRGRRGNEATSAPHIGSVPEAFELVAAPDCHPQDWDKLQLHGNEQFPDSPRLNRRCPSDSPRVGSIPEALDSPAHPPPDSPLASTVSRTSELTQASKSLQASENTDGFDERHTLSEPPLSSRAETASTAAGQRTSSSFETGSSTPLSARAVVPAAIHLPTHGTPWSSTLTGCSWAPPMPAGFAPAAASTAPAALQAQHHPGLFAAPARATVPAAWGGAAAAVAAAAAAAAGTEVVFNARASTRQLHTQPVSASQPTLPQAAGQPMSVGVMAPHPPSTLRLFGATPTPLAPAQHLQQACSRATPVTTQHHPLSSPVLRTQPRRAA